MVWGTIIGLVGGVAQDIITNWKEGKEKKQNQAFEMDKLRLQLSSGIKIQEEKTKEVEAQIEVQEQDTQKEWYKQLTKATEYVKEGGWLKDVVNLFIGTTRPIITYLLLIFVWHIYNTQNDNFELSKTIIIHVLSTLETATSFWFYRRGSDKIREMNLKKKA